MFAQEDAGGYMPGYRTGYLAAYIVSTLLLFSVFSLLDRMPEGFRVYHVGGLLAVLAFLAWMVRRMLE